MSNIAPFRSEVAQILGVEVASLENKADNIVILEFYELWTADNEDPMYVEMCADSLAANH